MNSITKPIAVMAPLSLGLMIFCLSLVADDLNIKVFDGNGNEVGIDNLIRSLQNRLVVWIGENHDRYDNHLAELEIIRQLHEAAPDRWVIGVEFIQRKFQ